MWKETLPSRFQCFDILSITNQMHYSALCFGEQLCGRKPQISAILNKVVRLYSELDGGGFLLLLLSVSRFCSKQNWIQTSAQTGDYIVFFAATGTRNGSIPQMHPCIHNIKKALTSRTMALLIREKQSAYSQSLTFTHQICAVLITTQGGRGPEINEALRKCNL